MKHRTLKAAIKNFIIAVLVYSVLSFTVIMFFYDSLFARADKNEYSTILSYDSIDFPCREVSFISGGNTLKGRVYNDGGAAGVVVLGHGKDGCGADMLSQARFFAENDYTAMVFDLTGHGESTGNGQRGLCQAAEDMKNAVLFCKNDEQLSGKPIFLCGMGESGYGAALCASIDCVKAVVTAGAFDNVPEMSLEYACSKMWVFGYLEYPIILLYQYIMFGDKLGASALDAINASNVPVLAIHGTKDPAVSFTGAAISAKRDKLNDNFTAFDVQDAYHGTVMSSKAAADALIAFNAEAYTVYNKYGGDVPVSEIKKLYDKYGRETMSELDPELMSYILDFFKRAF